MFVYVWPGCKLSSGIAYSDEIAGGRPAEFRAELSPNVELNHQYSWMVAIAYPWRPKCALWERQQVT